MSVDAQGLVGSIRDRGAFLSVKGDKLLVGNPAALDAETLDKLRHHKAEVIAILCCVPDCGALGSRTELGDGRYSMLCPYTSMN